MITKNDVLLLLTELQERGVDTKEDVNLLLSSETIPLDILKKINTNMPMDILKFYEKLRKSYNAKKSKLYINIMKSDENLIKNPKTILTTLSALLNQILQFDVEDRISFYKFSRADEISKALVIYFSTFNLEPAKKLLELYKADIKVLEMIK